MPEAEGNVPSEDTDVMMVSPTNSNHRAVIISLEETLAIHEATLQNLLRRQKALNIEKARRQRQKHEERLEALETRRETLEEMRQKHLDLQREIAEAVAKSQERLARVMATAQVEEDSIVATEDNVSETNNVAIETIAEGQANYESQQRVPVPNLHANEQTMADFWKSNGETGLAVFLPCLNSADLIQRIMNVTALETLALDQARPEGNHRQESLWKTCLDFVCIAGSASLNQVSSESEASMEEESSKENGDAAIDPNVALCPYELTGECADPFCPYQHIKPRNIAEQQILARERLPLPTLKIPAIPSTVGGDAIIPSLQELESPPASPLRKRRRIEQQDEEGDGSVQTQILEVEGDDGSAHTQILQDEEESVQTQLPSAANGERQGETGDGCVEDDKSESDDKGQVSMQWNDDFVSLPPDFVSRREEEKDSDLEEDESNKQVEGDQNATDNGEDTPEVPIRTLWWQTDADVARMKESPARLSILRLSLTDWLEMVAGFQVERISDDNGMTSLAIKCDGYPKSAKEAAAVTGCVVDCVRLCVHAGRFDLAHALCDYAESPLNSVFAKSNSTEGADEQDAIDMILRKTLGYLETARDASFNFNSDSRTTLYCAFETEILMATLSTSLQVLYEELSDDGQELNDHWLRDWSKGILEVFTSLSSATNGRATSLDTPKEPSNWIELSKELAILTRVKGGIEETISECRDYSHRLEKTMRAVHRGRSIVDLLLQCPMDVFVEEVLKPALVHIRHFSEKMKEHGSALHIVPVIYTQAYIILGCAASACAQVASCGEPLATIDACIYQIVMCLADVASKEPLTELCLAPLYALSVSLASSLRRYGKAQRRLEAALNVVLAKGRSALCCGYLIYSELLWSQLIQLRSSLPLLPESSKPNRYVSLSNAAKSGNRVVSLTANAFGIHPNHVTLCGDWNMLKAFDLKNRKHSGLAHVRKYCHALSECLFSRQRPCVNSPFCNLWRLPLTEAHMPMRVCSVPSLAFPRSTLLVGRELTVLVATKCDLKELPLTFGMHFPNLKVLKLAENGLTGLPESIGKLRTLADFDVSSNRLRTLPSSIGSLKKLVRLDASNNELSSLPMTIVKCKSLEELVLTNNPIRMRDLPNNLTLRCPNLYNIRMGNEEEEGT